MHDQFNKLRYTFFLGQKEATEDSYDNGQQKHQLRDCGHFRGGKRRGQKFHAIKFDQQRRNSI